MLSQVVHLLPTLSVQESVQAQSLLLHYLRDCTCTDNSCTGLECRVLSCKSPPAVRQALRDGCLQTQVIQRSGSVPAIWSFELLHASLSTSITSFSTTDIYLLHVPVILSGI